MKLAQLTDLFWHPPVSRLRLGLGASPRSNEPAAQIGEKAGEARLPLVEFVGVEQIGRHVAAWSDLAERALEPNVFLDPSFALQAAQRLAGAAPIGFLLAWDETAPLPRDRLLALWPVAPQGALFSLNMMTWVHDYCCSGAPLLDKAQAFASLDAIVNYLNESMSRACVLAISQLSRQGSIFALLSRYARTKGLELKSVRQYERAALDGAMIGLSSGDLVSSKRKKKLQRQIRRLHEFGPVTFGMTCDAPTLRQQIESFLVLEAKGWKGRAGRAFLNQPELTTFLRTMTRTMGGEGKCRVYWLACGERVIAANIVLLEGGAAYFWKTAYDEDFAFASPGVLLTMNMTDSLLREPHISSVDSCAVPDHPMIDHIWSGRIPLADVMLSLRSDKIRAFNGAVQREQFRLRLREKAKSALRRLNLA